jgi:hypothetical protein
MPACPRAGWTPLVPAGSRSPAGRRTGPSPARPAGLPRRLSWRPDSRTGGPGGAGGHRR